MIRTSRRTAWVEPRRRIVRSSSARSSLGCSSSGSSPISSRNTVPPWAASKAPSAPLAGAGERAPLVPEQLALDQRGRQRAAVDHHEGPAARAGPSGGSPRRSCSCRCRSRPRAAPWRPTAATRGNSATMLCIAVLVPSMRGPACAGSTGVRPSRLGDEHLQHAVADLDGDVGREVGALDPAAPDLGAVEAAQVAQQQTAGGPLDHAVEPRDGGIGHAEVIARRLADANLLLVDQPAGAAGRARHNRQSVNFVGATVRPPHVCPGRAVGLDVQVCHLSFG